MAKIGDPLRKFKELKAAPTTMTPPGRACFRRMMRVDHLNRRPFRACIAFNHATRSIEQWFVDSAKELGYHFDRPIEFWAQCSIELASKWMSVDYDIADDVAELEVHLRRKHLDFESRVVAAKGSVAEWRDWIQSKSDEYEQRKLAQLTIDTKINEGTLTDERVQDFQSLWIAHKVWSQATALILGEALVTGDRRHILS